MDLNSLYNLRSMNMSRNELRKLGFTYRDLDAYLFGIQGNGTRSFCLVNA